MKQPPPMPLLGRLNVHPAAIFTTDILAMESMFTGNAAENQRLEHSATGRIMLTAIFVRFQLTSWGWMNLTRLSLKSK